MDIDKIFPDLKNPVVNFMPIYWSSMFIPEEKFCLWIVVYNKERIKIYDVFDYNTSTALFGREAHEVFDWKKETLFCHYLLPWFKEYLTLEGWKSPYQTITVGDIGGSIESDDFFTVFKSASSLCSNFKDFKNRNRII